MNRPGSSSASMVTVAFTPDMHSTTAAGAGRGPQHAAAYADGPGTALISGSTAHGASIPGSAADEVDPITIVNVGQQREHQPGQEAGGRRPDAERVGQLDQPGEADRDDQRQPQPLDEPDRHVRQLAGQVERRHRHGVADGLVVQRAEGVQRVHQVPQAREVAPRVQVHAELGVEEHPARVVRQQDQRRRPATPARTSAARCCGAAGPIPRPVRRHLRSACARRPRPAACRPARAVNRCAA